MIEVVEKVEGEVVEKSYGAIVEEIRRKVTNALRFDRLGKRDELVVLIPEKEYDTLENTVLDVLICADTSKGHTTIFGVKVRPCQVDKIYVAYDEPEGGVYNE